MKKILFIFGLSFLFGYVNVLADECRGEALTNLIKEANNIKINYEILEEKSTQPVPKEYIEIVGKTETEVITEKIKINIYNITNNIYLEQTIDDNDDKKLINYSDTVNGKYSFVTDNISEYVNYKYNVYSNLNTCDKTLLKTINFIKPKHNYLSDFQLCVDNPDVPVCAKYITKDINLGNNDLEDVINKYKNSNSVIVTTKVVNNNSNNNYLLYGVIGGSILIIGVVVYIIISKRRSAL